MKTLVLAFSVVLCASQEKGQWVPISESVTSLVSRSSLMSLKSASSIFGNTSMATE